MTLSDFLSSLPKGGRSRFAHAVGVPAAYLYQIEKGLRKARPELSVRIEMATDGKVSRKDLHPHDWAEIWPELAEAA